MGDLQTERDMQLTTVINPGAFQKEGKVRLVDFVSKSVSLLRRGRIRKLGNFLLAGIVNYRNQVLESHLARRWVCNLCGTVSPFFIHKADDVRISWNSICPECASRSRHRGLFCLYQEVLRQKTGDIKVLHFAPEPVFYSLFKEVPGIIYHTTDYILKDVDFPGEDIQQLSFLSQSYDLILCNHILEHVPDDVMALREMERCLSLHGTAIITIPGDYKRQKTIYFNHLRFNGHYRDYGMDIKEKLENIFARVRIIDLSRWNDVGGGLTRGIRKGDVAFLCSRHESVFGAGAI